jgi:hypothetical protein
MQRHSIEQIRAAVAAAREAIRTADLSGCDADDIESLIEPVEHELEAPLPNVHTLATYLNSLARSFRSYPTGRRVSLQLDAAMRDAGVPTDWEH